MALAKLEKLQVQQETIKLVLQAHTTLLLARESQVILRDAKAVVDKAQAVSPDLVAALQAFGDRALAEKMAETMAPLAILGGESVAEVLARLLRGTPLARYLGAAKGDADDGEG